jgi:23S rRNA pseudouridine2605 synthase
MTNDGALSQRLTHPKFKLPKVYMVRIDRPLEPEHITEFLKGVQIEDGFARMDSVYAIKPTLLRITLSQGLKRQIRLMLGRFKYDVDQLKRVQIGSYRLNPKLREGEFKHLVDEELKQLLTAPEKHGKGEVEEEATLSKASLRMLKAKKIALNQSRYGEKENKPQISKGKGRAPDRSKPRETVEDRPTPSRSSFVRYGKSPEQRSSSRPPYKPRTSSEYSSSRPGKTFEEKSADRRRTSSDRSDSRRSSSRSEYGARSDRAPRSDNFRREDSRPRRSTGSTGSLSTFHKVSREGRSDSRRSSSRSEFGSRSDRTPRSDSSRREDSRSRPSSSTGRSFNKSFKKPSRSGNSFKKKY